MGLAIDGNEVHGIARGGQAFVSLGNVNTDGSINIGGQDYLNKNKMKIKDTGRLNINFDSSDTGTVASPVDVTSNLSNYGGCLAICLMFPTGSSYPALLTSQPIIIPTAPTTYKFSFEDSSFQNEGWSGSLSRTTDNKFTFVADFMFASSEAPTAVCNFYILSNN